MDEKELRKFAEDLALALADEVAYAGDENASENSLRLLERARKKLDLGKEFEEIDTLKNG